MVLNNIEPREVLTHFEALSNIPRSPRNEHAVTEHILAFAKECGLSFYRDEILNVIIKKPGSPGYENAPALILQGHTDMVCEKNSDVTHDFLKDPIKLVVDGDFLRAQGTTLGADNGVACAIMMALLGSKDIPHPPLECVFTSQEEIGLIGASKLDFSQLNAKAMINLDSGKEGQLTVGCAGGIKAVASLPAELISVPAESSCYVLSIKGLAGGHSGNDIHLGRGNANILMARVLMRLDDKFELHLVEINGGAQDNAIPRECTATIALNPKNEAALKTHLAEIEAEYKAELRVADPDIRLFYEPLVSNQPTQVISPTCTRKLLGLVALSPAGVLAMSLDIEGLVETSSNPAVIRTSGDTLKMSFMTRSSVESKRDFVVEQIRLLCGLIGADITVSAGYPGWQYAPVSRLRDVAVAAYKELYNQAPEVAAKHSGLEGGIFVGNIPGLDCISLGPDLFDLHSPDERMSLPSLQRTWAFLKKLLAQLN